MDGQSSDEAQWIENFCITEILGAIPCATISVRKYSLIDGYLQVHVQKIHLLMVGESTIANLTFALEVAYFSKFTHVSKCLYKT